MRASSFWLMGESNIDACYSTLYAVLSTYIHNIIVAAKNVTQCKQYYGVKDFNLSSNYIPMLQGTVAWYVTAQHGWQFTLVHGPQSQTWFTHATTVYMHLTII